MMQSGPPDEFRQATVEWGGWVFTLVGVENYGSFTKREGGWLEVGGVVADAQPSRHHAPEPRTNVDPDHSVTCPLCGEIADERRTITLDPHERRGAAPEAFETIGRAFVAREVFGDGEAHAWCLEHRLLDAIEEVYDDD